MAPPILTPPMAELPGRLMFGLPAGRLAGLAAGRAPPPGRPAGVGRTISGLPAARPACTANSPRPAGPACTANPTWPADAARTAWPADPTRSTGPARAANPAWTTGATYAANSTRPANPAGTASTTNAPWSSRSADAAGAIGADPRLAAHAGSIVAVRPPRLYVADVDVIADIDVAVVDVATPARIAGPGRRIDRARSPVPVVVVPQRADRDAGPEAQERRDPCIRLIDCSGVIGRDIDRRRIGRLDGDIARRGLRRCRPLRRASPWRRARLNSLDGLLIRRLKRPSRFRLGAKVLDDLGDVLGLVHFGVAEVRRPIEIRAHQLDDVRKARQRLHRGIPILVVDSGIVVLGDERLVLVEPALRLDDLHGIGARWQHLRQQGVGIKRDWSKQLLELVAAEALLRPPARRRWPLRRSPDAVGGAAGLSCACAIAGSAISAAESAKASRLCASLLARRLIAPAIHVSSQFPRRAFIVPSRTEPQGAMSRYATHKHGVDGGEQIRRDRSFKDKSIGPRFNSRQLRALFVVDAESDQLQLRKIAPHPSN